MLDSHFPPRINIPMNGWTGKILKINLTEKTTSTVIPQMDVYKKFIGGKGLAGYYLKPCITNEYNHSEMSLIFMTGPLVDTPSPTSGRMVIMSRSPLTGTIGDTSVGGKFATQLKRAGWDGVIIQGKSSSLMGIDIIDDVVTFHDAAFLQGKTVSDTVYELRSDSASAVIGPAAENGVRFANIAVDEHFFSGRNGLGLVMAEKQLKYVTVKGTGNTTIFNKDILMSAREEIFRLASASPILKGELGISNFGTGALFDLIHSRRMMPTNNFKETYFTNAQKLNAYQYKVAYNTKKTGCFGCHILCKKKGEDDKILPEFETMSHFSALLRNSNIDIVKEANLLCNDLGMDTISAAATLACYSEIRDITLKPEKILSLLNDIAYSQNEGAALKEGSFRYAESENKVEASITVKKLELPAYDPRGAYGMALAYCTSTRGGCHLRSYPISHEILRKPVATDRFSFSGKARIIKLTEDINSMIDSLTACKFLFFAATLEEYAKALYGATGMMSSSQELMKIGERIYYNERIMNTLNGFSSDEDILPERFFTEAGSSGDGIDIPPIDKNDFLETRNNYYIVRGLDENGLPLKNKCEELELNF